MSRALALAALMATAPLGCSPSPVVVAQQQEPSEAGVQTCGSWMDCPGGAFCSKASCGDLEGECVLAPLNCDSDEMEVCGCDGVIYWNDCLRQRDGIESKIDGFCTTHFLSCGRPQDKPCPDPDAVCARVSPGGPGMQGQCGGQPGGECWVLPDSCPVDAGGPPLGSCVGPPMCSDFCSALKSEPNLPHVRLPACP
jgi:hypothetical protein